MLTEISQREKDKYDLTYMWNLKKQKQTKLVDTADWWLPEMEEGCQVGKMGEGDQIFNVQHGDYS